VPDSATAGPPDRPLVASSSAYCPALYVEVRQKPAGLVFDQTIPVVNPQQGAVLVTRARTSESFIDNTFERSTMLFGQGRLDVVPAGDLGYLKLVGRLTTGHPRAFADEAEVRGFFARYAPWAGLAGEYLRFAAATGRLRARPAGTRRSAAARSTAPA
jgi:hypothetical protein